MPGQPVPKLNAPGGNYRGALAACSANGPTVSPRRAHSSSSRAARLHADLVPGGGNGRGQRARPAGHRAQHEERRAHLGAVQRGQETRCAVRVGAIVAGERHVVGLALPGQRREESPAHRADRGRAGCPLGDHQGRRAGQHAAPDEVGYGQLRLLPGVP